MKSNAYARLRWLIMIVLFIGGGISYLDRAALSVAAPLVAKDLGLDAAQLGIVFSCFFWGYAPFCFVGGWASDKIGPKNVFTIAMTVWSVFCGLTAAATGMVTLVIVRIIFGTGEGPFSATANKAIANWFPRKEQASAIGVANAGQPLGAAIAGPLVGVIAVSAGWRASFVIIAVIGLLWVLGWLLIMKDRPQDHRLLRNVPMEELAEEAPPPPPPPTIPLGAYLRRPAILATGFAFFGYAYILYFFLAWFPSYLTMARHLSVHNMAFVNAIPWLVGFLGLVSSGFVCDALFRRTGDALFARKAILVSSLMIAAVCVALAGVATTITMVVILMAVSVFFMYLTASTYFAIVLDTVEGGRVGAVGGFVHTIANCAGIVAPMATGFLVQETGTFTSAFILTGAIAVVGAVAVAIFVRRPTPVEDAETAVAAAL